MMVEGNIVDIFKRQIFFGQVWYKEGKITEIKVLDKERPSAFYILPGFVDAHVHIESSMLTPSHFARLAVVHGTVGTVSDPHEIGNVLGTEGVEYMLKDAKKCGFHFAFGAPSCVPATSFETAGAEINAHDIDGLLQNPEIYYLAEMMNYPGVIHEDPEVMQKLSLAKQYGKPIDGHAPGLRGEDADRYFSHGISTDHECYETDEAAYKLQLGVKILVREGSAAKNFDALMPLARHHAPQMMFCSDDKHPDGLVLGHINSLVRRARQEFDIDLFDTLYMACVHPVLHYKMPVGLLRPGDSADFIVIKDLLDFEVLQTYLNGSCVAEDGVSHLVIANSDIVNNFCAESIGLEPLKMPVPKGTQAYRVIEANNGQLITGERVIAIEQSQPNFVSDIEKDVLKIVVYNRYSKAGPALALIHGFGLKKGAIASSVAHDSHNIIAVGTNDEDLVTVINEVVKSQGGVAACHGSNIRTLPLPVAGLMSHTDGYEVADAYQQVDMFTKEVLGAELDAPFMTLSFMALLVIPNLKLSDKGLFDARSFAFTQVWC